MAGAATCHERLARSIGELRHAVTALQAKARSQEVVLTELGHRASKGQGLSGWVDPADLGSRTRASSPSKDRIRQLESSLASLRTRVELLEETRPAQPSATSLASTAGAVAEAAASAAKANEDIAEIKRASTAMETSFRDALRSCEADVRQRMDDVQRQIDCQAKALDAALRQDVSVPSRTISHVDRASNPTSHSARTCRDVSGTHLQVDNLSLEKRLTELEVGLALQRRSSDDSMIRLRSEVTRALKLAKVEGARLEGAMEAKLDELDYQVRASAHGAEPGGLISDRQVLDQAMQAVTSRVTGSMQASLRVLGDRQHCLDLQISSVTMGLRACGEEQERLAREAAVRNERLERRFAELSEACQSSNEAADIREQQQRRLSAVEEQQVKTAEEQQKRLADLEKQFSVKLSSLATQESSQAIHGRLESVDRSLEERFEAMQSKLSKACTGLLNSREVAQHSKLVEELQQKMKDQAAEVSCFKARLHGEFSEVLHQAGQASEAAAVAGAVAKRGQEAAHRLWDEEAEFREHLAAAVGSLRAEIVDRHATLEDRLTRSQGRVAQELGEQRARADSRMASLEEQLISGSLAELLLRDVEELSQSVVKREIQFAKEELMKATVHEFDCILECLSTLYKKVGLSSQDALASLQRALKPESEEPVPSNRFSPRDRRNDGPDQMTADRFTPRDRRNDGPHQITARSESSTPRTRKESQQPKLRVRRHEVGPGSCQAAARQTPRQGKPPGPSRLGSPGGPGGSPGLTSPRPSSLSGLAPPGPPSLGGRGTVGSA
eukprot:TRINITY_DN41319_c0_g1_i1.p1 TRINITY_DN41319_c0_g1~~TRINITY_DN41319_c0_g1_i1.p1  ORF type:complete len:785 (-),score=174.42 TRINITY_DN41319_c0_g1_i1:97-2451(-)